MMPIETTCLEPVSFNAVHSGYILQKNKLNPFHGLMLLPKPYGVERKVLVFAKVKSSKWIQLGWSIFLSGIDTGVLLEIYLLQNL